MERTFRRCLLTSSIESEVRFFLCRSRAVTANKCTKKLIVVVLLIIFTAFLTLSFPSSSSVLIREL